MRMRAVGGKRIFPLVNRRRSTAFIFDSVYFRVLLNKCSEPANGVLAKP